RDAGGRPRLHRAAGRRLLRPLHAPPPRLPGVGRGPRRPAGGRGRHRRGAAGPARPPPPAGAPARPDPSPPPRPPPVGPPGRGPRGRGRGGALGRAGGLRERAAGARRAGPVHGGGRPDRERPPRRAGGPPPSAGAAVAAMDIALIHLLNALLYASVLFLIAGGLSLIYGVMRIVNLAHGNLYAFGAYVSAWVV